MTRPGRCRAIPLPREGRESYRESCLMSNAIQDCAPVRPVAPYFGGKRNLAGRIVPRLRAIPHHLYLEPFVGMGGVFLRRDFISPVEVINDASGDVATLFRVLQRHFNALCDMLRWQVTSREEFERLRAQSAETLTDLERTVRFLYIQRVGFGGKIAGRSFGASRTQAARFDVTKLVPMLEETHRRLARVTIERLPWADAITRYDTPGTLMYLDPPYWGHEEDYGKNLFSRADFECMAGVLAGIKGRFVLSLNDCPGVRECFRSFTLEPVETTYSNGREGAAKVAKELLISN